MRPSLAGDALRLWRIPGEVFARRLACTNEGGAFGVLLLGCFVIFVGQWPRLAREAHFAPTDAGGEGAALMTLVGVNLVGMLLVAPLFLLLLAALGRGVCGLLGHPVGGLAARLALGWALLGVAPLLLAQGIVSGFAGPGALAAGTGAVVLAAFLWLWGRLLRLAPARRRGGCNV